MLVNINRGNLIVLRERVGGRRVCWGGLCAPLILVMVLQLQRFDGDHLSPGRPGRFSILCTVWSIDVPYASLLEPRLVSEWPFVTWL